MKRHVQELVLYFKLGGKIKKVTIDNPHDGITEEEIVKLMDLIKEKEMFVFTEGKNSIAYANHKAELIDKDIEEYDLVIVEEQEEA